MHLRFLKKSQIGTGYLPGNTFFYIFSFYFRLRRKQCCGSGMFIPDPDYYPSRISDPGYQIQKQEQKRKGVKKNLLLYLFFCSHKCHKIVNYFIFEMQKKKIWVNFQRIIEPFTQKTVTKLSKIWVWDPGSEIRDPEKNLFRIPV